MRELRTSSTAVKRPRVAQPSSAGRLSRRSSTCSLRPSCRVDDSEEDTEHAVKDHNKIRSTTQAVDDHPVGSDAWWEAFKAAREETVEHLEEEEHDVLPPFKDEVGEDKRTVLGMRWLQFRDAHESAKGLSGQEKDPQEYVEQKG